MDESGTIKVNSSSIIDLKAELYRKQESFKLAKLAQEQKQTNDNDGIDLYLNHATNQKYKLGKRIRDKTNKEDKIGNSINSRQEKQDEEERIEEEKALQKSREMLIKKAKIYEEKCKNLPNFKEDDSDDEESEDERILVDFQRKAIDEMRRKKLDEVKKEEEIIVDEDDWTEFVDSLGRSRKCLKKDLEYLKQIDNEIYKSKRNLSLDLNNKSDDSNFLINNLNRNNELLSNDLKRELDRRDWESNAFQDLEESSCTGEKQKSTQQGPIHYQNVQFNEIRDHGVGYYAFAEDDQKRQEQMKMLNTLREQTVNQKAAREKVKEKRKMLMRQRLSKIAQRKGIKVELPESSEEEEESDDEKDQQKQGEPVKCADVVQQISKPQQSIRDHKPVKIREWDIGKDQLEITTTPTRFMKNYHYIKERRNQRDEEFAPPSTYFIEEKKKNNNFNQNKTYQRQKFKQSPFHDKNNNNNNNNDNKERISKSCTNSSTNSSSVPSSSSSSSSSSSTCTSKIDVQKMIGEALSFYRQNTKKI